jgi:nitroreductase
MSDANEEDRKFYSATDAAVIAENVYLFCAATGLATVLRGLIDRKALASAMQLGPQQRVILAQTVGFPPE